MESNQHKKRKKTEVTRNQDHFKKPSVRKSANRSGFGHSKVTEIVSKPPLEQLKNPRKRIKLQLFPINDVIKLGLEKDGYNPHLELTLSSRKKVSSIIRHLNGKWGCSNVASRGELMLFPNDTKPEQHTSCKRWTSNDELVTAWEVYVAVGSPTIFRLRYGWLSNHMQKSCYTPLRSYEHNICYSSEVGDTNAMQMPNHPNGSESTDEHANIKEICAVNDIPAPNVEDEVRFDIPTAPSSSSILPWDDSFTNLSIGGLLSELSQQKKMDDQPVNQQQPILLIPSDISIGGLLSEASLLSGKKKMEEDGKEACCLWGDASSISIGGLLSEPPPTHPMKSEYHETPNVSILDAEETCHGFPRS